MGIALRDRGDLDGAIAHFQQAIRLEPKLAMPHISLGNVLFEKGDLDGAAAQYREAIRLDPKLAMPHIGLGNALQAKGDLDGTIAQYEEATRLDPTRRDLLPYLQRYKQMRALLPRLANVLAGKDKPQSPAETYAFGYLCFAWQRCYGDAVRFYQEAFAADPTLAKDLASENRYDAACAAALGGCGKGKDAAQHDSQARARLRAQALFWLRADLLLHREHASAAEAPVRRYAADRLKHWLVDPDLLGVRPGPNQVAMPAEERATWEKLWAEVKATLALAQRAVPATPRK
jgi:tetratricopeptide (TPR) repeat protein